MNALWLIFAILSAISAAFVCIFGKLGLQNIDSITATAIRAVIMAILLIGVVAFEENLGKIPAIVGEKKTLMLIVLRELRGQLLGFFISCI